MPFLAKHRKLKERKVTRKNGDTLLMNLWSSNSKISTLIIIKDEDDFKDVSTS